MVLFAAVSLLVWVGGCTASGKEEAGRTERHWFSLGVKSHHLGFFVKSLVLKARVYGKRRRCVCVWVYVSKCLRRETGNYGWAETVKVKGGLAAQVSGNTLEENSCSQLKAHLSEMTEEQWEGTGWGSGCDEGPWGSTLGPLGRLSKSGGSESSSLSGG